MPEKPQTSGAKKKQKRPAGKPPKKGYVPPPAPKPKPGPATVSETARRVEKVNRDIADNRLDFGSVLNLAVQLAALVQVNLPPDVSAQAHQVRVESAIAAMVPAGKEVELSWEVIRRDLPDTVHGPSQALVPIEGTFNVGRIGQAGYWPKGADIVRTRVVGTGPAQELPIGPYFIEAIRLAKDANEVAAEFKRVAEKAAATREPVYLATPVSDNLLQAINKVLDQRLDKRSDPAGGGGGGGTEPDPGPAPATNEEVEELRGQLPDLVDVPGEPGPGESPGGVAVASLPRRRQDRRDAPQAKPAVAVTPEQAELRALVSGTYDHLLAMLEAVLPAVPQPPSDPRTHTSVGQQVDVDKLRKLDGYRVDESGTASRLGVLHRKLLGAVSSTDALVHRADGRWVGTWAKMLLSGRFRPLAESATPGDLCLILDPTAPGGSYPAIVLDADADRPREILAAVERAGQLTVFDFPATATVMHAWTPRPAALFDDTSPIGQFWGPQGRRLRLLLDAHATGDVYERDLLEVLHGAIRSTRKTGGRHATEVASVDDLKTLVWHQTHPVSSAAPWWPGAVVFGRRDEIGVVQADGSVLGTSEISQYPGLVDLLPTPRFAPSRIWYPATTAGNRRRLPE